MYTHTSRPVNSLTGIQLPVKAVPFLGCGIHKVCCKLCFILGRAGGQAWPAVVVVGSCLAFYYVECAQMLAATYAARRLCHMMWAVIHQHRCEYVF